MHEKPCYQLWYVEKFSYLGGSWPGKSELEQCYSSPPLTWQSLNLFIFSLISCLKILLITFQLTHFSFQKLQLSRGCAISIIQLFLWVGLISCFPSYLGLDSAVQKLRFGMEMGGGKPAILDFWKEGQAGLHYHVVISAREGTDHWSMSGKGLLQGRKKKWEKGGRTNKTDSVTKLCFRVSRYPETEERVITWSFLLLLFNSGNLNLN